MPTTAGAITPGRFPSTMKIVARPAKEPPAATAELGASRTPGTLTEFSGMSHESEPPDGIYIIRHAEKPYEPAQEHHAHRGADFRGKRNDHSLIPRGWQRSGALAALFDPVQGPLRPGLRAP